MENKETSEYPESSSSESGEENSDSFSYKSSKINSIESPNKEEEIYSQIKFSGKRSFSQF